MEANESLALPRGKSGKQHDERKPRDIPESTQNGTQRFADLGLPVAARHVRDIRLKQV